MLKASAITLMVKRFVIFMKAKDGWLGEAPSWNKIWKRYDIEYLRILKELGEVPFPTQRAMIEEFVEEQLEFDKEKQSGL